MTSAPDPSALNLEVGELLRSFRPFDRLPPEAAAAVEPLLEARRYRLGQTILRPDVMPEGLLLLRSGLLRSLATDPLRDELQTIEQLHPGSIAGWCGILRSEPCEHLRASTEAEVLLLPNARFRDLLEEHEAVRLWFQSALPAAELHLLLVTLYQQEPHWLPALQSWPALRDQARLRSLPPGQDLPLHLPGDLRWYVSSGGSLAQPWQQQGVVQAPRPGAAWLRLVGLPRDPEQCIDASTGLGSETPSLVIGADDISIEGPLSSTSAAESLEITPQRITDPDYALSPAEPAPRTQGRGELRLPRASGPRDIPIALVTALARYFGLPVNRDALRDQVQVVLERQGQLNLGNLGQILDSLGLRVVLSEIPCNRLARAITPAVLFRDGHFALLDGVDEDGNLRLLEPELGPLQLPPEQLAQGDESGLVKVLLVQRKPDAKEERFGWSWYAPFLQEHYRPLVEVLALSTVVNLLALATPLGIQVMIDQVVRQNSVGALITVAVFLLLAALVEGVLKTLRSYILTDVANRVDQATKSTILDRLVRLPQAFFDSRPVGQVMFYFRELDRLREFLLGQSITTLLDFCFGFIYLAVLLLISVPLTIASLATLPLMLALAVVSNPLIRRQIQRSINESVKTFSFLNESITGIQTLKSQNAELSTRWEFQNRYARFVGEDFKLKITRDAIGNIAEFINNLNGVVVAGVGVYLIMKSELSFGAFIAFRILSGYITRPLVQLVQTWQQLEQSSASIQLVADIVDRPAEQSELDALNIPMPPLRGEVRFEGIAFGYAPDQPPVLDGVDLDVPAGAFVGLVGGSGSGKSTLLKMLPRFYVPTRGRVLLDDLDIAKVELYSLRRQIGVVPQDSVLFDGSIRDNLLLVKPDATADEMIGAARIACAHDFIMAMPKGYNSSVGERGAGLSGGQRQRLALARAVLQNPRMLILDEATSALDARTERQVCLNLLEAFRGRTVFFITHRLTTVQPADAIVLMDRGAVMEVGTHRELMRRQGWYYALYQSQMQEGGV